MKYVFVRYTEDDNGNISGPLSVIASGKSAESRQAFIDSTTSGGQVMILEWLEVSEEWENLVASDGVIYNTFRALLVLDALADTPVVSDLLATIFETGYRLALGKE